ncbi:hypothetical protein HPB50_024853 [Hyalomma asiaticum]|uniref:Uncharacterized protein n=1 Tax=Hyalomma asiaticum TaxID=266040 RepID=A0ACB7SFN6_HYAAI|nr:hypothetical protein HPB50_024853 [Hyalomma asiaticum]
MTQSSNENQTGCLCCGSNSHKTAKYVTNRKANCSLKLRWIFIDIHLSPEHSSDHYPIKTFFNRLGERRVLQKKFNQCTETHADMTAYFRKLAEKDLLGWNAKWQEKLSK